MGLGNQENKGIFLLLIRNMNVDLLVLQKSLTGSWPSNQFVPILILPCQPDVFLETADPKMTSFPALLQTNGFLFITVHFYAVVLFFKYFKYFSFIKPDIIMATLFHFITKDPTGIYGLDSI